MPLSAPQLRKYGVALAIGLVILSAIGVYVGGQLHTDIPPAPKADARVTTRGGNVVKFKLGAELAASYGIEAMPAKAIHWYPRAIVDGRVLANPDATLEVRSPFAGVLRADSKFPTFRLGGAVEARQTLASCEARFSALENLDLRAKRVEAEVRYHSAEEVLKIRKERVRRLGEIPGSVSRTELDSAAIQLSEAQVQRDVALKQWEIWKQATESVGKSTIIVPIIAPISGEIAEIGAQPGANVESGQLLLRLVDFRRVLVRLDFPLFNLDASPPKEIEVQALAEAALTTSTRAQVATLRGAAPSVEVGLQKAGYLYEFTTPQKDASFRPGVFVTATYRNDAAPARPAVEIPASALLVHQGRTLVYVQLSPGRYERREVMPLGSEGDKLFVSAGVRGDELVVCKHAQVLLSEEFRSDVEED